MKNIVKAVCALSIPFWMISGTFAGTTQIYSPSGLSPNVAPDLAPPVAAPPISPTSSSPSLEFAPVGAPSPNTSLTTSPQPGNSSSLPALQDSIVKDIWPGQPQNNSVESFFQLKPNSAVSQPLSNSTAALRAQSAPSSKDKSIFGNLGRLIWHTLDNAGVPMFIGKDNDLDPSLRNSNKLSSASSTKGHSSTSTLNNGRAGSTANILERITPNNNEGPPQKIPQSELEGTEVSPKNDSQASTP